MSFEVSYAHVSGDVLYGVEMRPQELMLYGDGVPYTLRYSPIFDDPTEVLETHYKLLVLELTKTLPPDVGLGRDRALDLCLLKIGWQLELVTAVPLRADMLSEDANEVPFLLSRIASTVNDLATRAGVEAPLGPGVVEQLVTHYRSHHSGA